MSPDAFRRLALALPAAEEREHMGHPDFRVGGRIFATLSGDVSGGAGAGGAGGAGGSGARPGGLRAGRNGDEPLGMVKLTAQQQQAFVRGEPDVFVPCSGAWGRGGATHVRLRRARTATVRQALAAAWRNTAPKRLLPRSEP